MRGVLFEGFHGGPAASGFASLPSATFRWSEFYKSREIISEARRLILVSTGNLDWKWWEGLPFKNSNPRDFFCWMFFFFFFCKNGWTIKWERNPWWVFGCSVDLPSSFKLPQGGGSIPRSNVCTAVGYIHTDFAQDTSLEVAQRQSWSASAANDWMLLGQWAH